MCVVVGGQSAVNISFQAFVPLCVMGLCSFVSAATCFSDESSLREVRIADRRETKGGGGVVTCTYTRDEYNHAFQLLLKK